MSRAWVGFWLVIFGIALHWGLRGACIVTGGLLVFSSAFEFVWRAIQLGKALKKDVPF